MVISEIDNAPFTIVVFILGEHVALAATEKYFE
jgi:hypothetical protein